MIIEQQKLEKKHDWSSSEINRWADYIELLCIKEDTITESDIVEECLEGDFENELARGEREHSLKMDSLYNKISDYFKILESREYVCGEYYPFEVRNGDCLCYRGICDEKKKQYIFLLLCSSISLMASYHKYTDSFEKLCRLLMKELSPKGTTVELFGTSRESELFTGTLRDRIKKLAKCLGTETTKRFDQNAKFDSIFGGDGGIDIVAFTSIDEAGFVPFSFSQCTCSYDKWKEKQTSIGVEQWGAYIELGVHYPQYMFVPFSCHNSQGKFCDETSIKTFLIDRLRIIKLIEKNRLEDDMLKEFYSFVDVNEIV